MGHEGSLFIGGAWIAPSTGEVIEVISPHTEAGHRPCAGGRSRRRRPAVAAARAALDEGPWPRLDPAERIAAVRRLAGSTASAARRWPQVITAEMGAPISFSKFAQATLPMIADVTPSPTSPSGYAWEERRPGHYGQDITVRKEPVGVVAAIVPWNMPQFLVVGKLAPALLAGCPIVIKPAPETPLDALLLAELIERGRPARGASSASCPAAARSGSSSSATPASTRSPSPAPPPPVGRSPPPAVPTSSG